MKGRKSTRKFIKDSIQVWIKLELDVSGLQKEKRGQNSKQWVEWVIWYRFPLSTSKENTRKNIKQSWFWAVEQLRVMTGLQRRKHFLVLLQRKVFINLMLFMGYCLLGSNLRANCRRLNYGYRMMCKYPESWKLKSKNTVGPPYPWVLHRGFNQPWKKIQPLTSTPVFSIRVWESVDAEDDCALFYTILFKELEHPWTWVSNLLWVWKNDSIALPKVWRWKQRWAA